MAIQEILDDLLKLNKSIDYLEQEVKKIPWDIETEVVLTYKIIDNIFERFLNGEITPNEIERWADLIEFRDGIDFQDIEGLLNISDIIFQLANPELNSQISRDLICAIKKGIGHL